MIRNIYVVVNVLSRHSTISGDHREKETPVPIPNTAVKLLIADDTILETIWKSRTLPDSIKRIDHFGLSLFFRFKKDTIQIKG